ncbi:MAG TPA: hypothetical protein VE326_10020, partial [Candidatus Binatia bacterium]|nr:hypothetical protein [Candidatus Binatia bacterium]
SELNTWYGAMAIPPEFRKKTNKNPYSDPTYALLSSRLATGQYALQVSYVLRGGQNQWREPLQLQSDTLFFNVAEAAGTWEDSLLAGYARAVDSVLALPGVRRNRAALEWLPRFSNSRFFTDVLLDTWSGPDSIPPERLFGLLDPNGNRSTSRAVMLDLLLGLRTPTTMRDPSTLSPYARGDLARQVIDHWKALKWRWGYRDSVYAERQKYPIRDHPPYGTWIEPGNATKGPPASEEAFPRRPRP